MSEIATKLLHQLLQLSEDDRLEIAERLWGSVGDEKFQQIMDDTTSDPEFQAELERRLESVANGTAVLIDSEQAMRELRERLAQRQDERRNNPPRLD